MRPGPGGIDRQDGEVFGRRSGVCEPLDERSRAVVLVSIQRDHARRVPSRPASVRLEPAHVDGGAEGTARPTVRPPGLPVAAIRGVRRPSRRIARSTTGPRYVVRRVPRIGSNRSMATTTARVPAWIRSSIGTCHAGTRRASVTTNPRRVSTRAFRTRSQRSPAARAVAGPGPSTTRSSCRMSHVARSGSAAKSTASAATGSRGCGRGSRAHPSRSCQVRRRARSRPGLAGPIRRLRRTDAVIGPPWIHGSQSWRPASWMLRTRAAACTSAVRAWVSSAISEASVTASRRRRRRGTVSPSRADRGGSRVRLSIGRRGGVSPAVGGARRPRWPARPGCRSRAGLACVPRCAAPRAPPRGSQRAG